MVQAQYVAATGRGASPDLLVPPTTVLAAPGAAAWPQANRAIFARVSVPVAKVYRYLLWQVDTASGNVQVGVVRLSGADRLTTERVMNSGVIACPTAGAVRSDLGATELTPGEYALFLWADNITFQTRFQNVSTLTALRLAGTMNSQASGVQASSTLAWSTEAPSLALEANV